MVVLQRSVGNRSATRLLSRLREKESFDVPAAARASVLVDTLRGATYLNDFGHLGPGGGADGISPKIAPSATGCTINCVPPISPDRRRCACVCSPGSGR